MTVSTHTPQKPVTLTETAVAYLEKEVAKVPNAKAFRLSVKDSGCNGLAYVTDIIDTIPENDISEAVSDKLILCVDPKAIPAVFGTEIDYTVYEHSLGLKKLVFRNPNVKGECGCGESFNIEGNDHDE